MHLEQKRNSYRELKTCKQTNHQVIQRLWPLLKESVVFFPFVEILQTEVNLEVVGLYQV